MNIGTSLVLGDPAEFQKIYKVMEEVTEDAKNLVEVFGAAKDQLQNRGWKGPSSVNFNQKSNNYYQTLIVFSEYLQSAMSELKTIAELAKQQVQEK